MFSATRLAEDWFVGHVHAYVPCAAEQKTSVSGAETGGLDATAYELPHISPAGTTHAVRTNEHTACT